MSGRTSSPNEAPIVQARWRSRRRAAGSSDTTAGAAVQGRWSLTEPLFANAPGPGARLRAQAELMLERYGIVTRETVLAEGVPGGFSTLYPELANLELLGTARRGYFVEGLGGAQFALAGAVERLRSLPEAGGEFQVLAATDPANPYGAALPWPDHDGTHRPGRKAGALVVLVDGDLALYVERGGKSLLSWAEETASLQPAVDALALAVRDGMLGKLAVERADGEAVLTSPLGSALEQAGFRPTPRGLRMRA